VSHIYPDGTEGIHNMCFRIYEKEIVAICGANGSGKSTLLEHLNGLLVPSSGKVYVMGQELDGKMKRENWRYVGLVFQKPEDQLFAPTVIDDVMFGPVNMGMGVEEARAAAVEALDSVGALEVMNKVPAYLSGGQRRLVSIAGILAMKPRVIAMDEPTSDLDARHSAMVEHIIRELRDRFGISVVIATHNLDMAARLADRVCVVKKGCVLAEGTPREVFYDKRLIENAGLNAPEVVQIYEDYCAKYGVQARTDPITINELLEAVR
jgi:cobalt/nickel transport system ATP-binding protein